MYLIEMDKRVLSYLVEHGGRLPDVAIPSRLFRGEIPEGTPSMVELGLIRIVNDEIEITDAGRAALMEAD
jgi:hypothetical protein